MILGQVPKDAAIDTSSVGGLPLTDCQRDFERLLEDLGEHDMDLLERLTLEPNQN